MSDATQAAQNLSIECIISLCRCDMNYFTFTFLKKKSQQAKMKKILNSIIAMLLFFTAMAQQANETKPVNLLQKRIDDLKGTYELRYLSNDRMMYSLPSNLADIIDKNRKATENNTILLNEKLQLIIYPANHLYPTTK